MVKVHIRNSMYIWLSTAPSTTSMISCLYCRDSCCGTDCQYLYSFPVKSTCTLTWPACVHLCKLKFQALHAHTVCVVLGNFKCTCTLLLVVYMYMYYVYIKCIYVDIFSYFWCVCIVYASFSSIHLHTCIIGVAC